ncbi:MAG: tetratricopeptide repeat protein [Pyrinomonadaceae bacterium]
MNINTKKILFNNTISINSNLIIRLSAFLSVFIFFAVNNPAQNSLRDSLKTKSDKPAVKKTTESKPRTSPRISSNKSSPRTTKKAAVQPKQSLITVTFVTGEPYAEVWLNDKKSGQANENSILEKKLAMGEYRVMARNKFRVIYPMTRISISSEQNTFKLFEENVVEENSAKTENTESNKKKTDEELAMEISGEVKRILQDYADPQKTDSISASDWELVYKAAQLGQLQGYSAVDVEAQRWFASGQLEFAKQNYTNAFTAFNKAMEFMPASGLLYYAVGNTYLANKQPSDALKAYQKSIQLSPKMGMTYKKLGDAYRILDKEKEAISAYKSAVQFGYNNVETRFGLALTLLKTKQTEEAITQLLEVAKEKPAAEVYLALGEAYEKTKRDVSAIEYYQKAIQAAPNSAVGYFKLGDVYFSQREYVKAKETFEKAAQLDPDGKVLNKVEAQKKIREAASKIK